MFGFLRYLQHSFCASEYILFSGWSSDEVPNTQFGTNGKRTTVTDRGKCCYFDYYCYSHGDRSRLVVVYVVLFVFVTSRLICPLG